MSTVNCRVDTGKTALSVNAARVAMVACLVWLIGACQTQSPRPDSSALEDETSASAGSEFGSGEIAGSDDEPYIEEPVRVVESGTGVFLNEEAANRPIQRPADDGEITFNFEGQPLQEVVKTILGDLLQENYVIAPGVSGQVTFATAKPIRTDQVMAVLEMLLAWNNATLVYTEGRYNVVPIGQAVKGKLTPRTDAVVDGLGFQVRAFPLRYISAAEMEKLLKPYAQDYAFINVDPARNMIVMSGTPQELANYRSTIDTFDVDWLAGMSVGIYPLERVEVDTVVPELETLFGEGAATPLAGMFRFMPMERLNAILVITTQPGYLLKAEEWIDVLDRSAGAAGTRLYVYEVKNVKSTDLADILNDAFGSSGGSSSRSTDSSLVAPGLDSVEITSINDPRRSESQSQTTPSTPARGGAGADGGLSLVSGEDIRITAVEESNSLVIRASPPQYEAVLGAIKRLDTIPLQVLIETKIIEVSLEDDFAFGVQWFFEGAVPSTDPTTKVEFSTEGATLGSTFTGSPTLSYAFVANNARVLLDALQTNTTLNVLSSPSLMVLNNREANINVGDQIPVVTTFINTGNTNPGNNTRNTVQFRDVGIILSVTPRVNPGGLVFMEVSQEVSNVEEGAQVLGGNVPVQRRTLDTEIAVQSGETVVLGGLISETTSQGKSGVPFLSRVPLLGNLFGQTRSGTDRTELIIMITPTVVRSADGARQVTEEYQNKFKGLEPLRERAGEGW